MEGKRVEENHLLVERNVVRDRTFFAAKDRRFLFSPGRGGTMPRLCLAFCEAEKSNAKMAL